MPFYGKYFCDCYNRLISSLSLYGPRSHQDHKTRPAFTRLRLLIASSNIYLLQPRTPWKSRCYFFRWKSNYSNYTQGTVVFLLGHYSLLCLELSSFGAFHAAISWFKRIHCKPFVCDSPQKLIPLQKRRAH